MNEQLPVAAMAGQTLSEQTLSEHSRLFNIHPVLMRIIHERGYDTPEKLNAYLNPSFRSVHSPFLMDGMYDAVARVRNALEENHKIGIFADSDLDGITSLAVLHMLFTRMKKDVFIRYLKNDENYGLTRGIIDEFAANDVKLMITVDSGTRDRAEISHARSLGIDVIVTDHHEQDSELPDAIVINPKKSGCEYPFKHLAGVGVAFKFSLAILMSYQHSYKKTIIIITGSDTGFLVSAVQDGAVTHTAHPGDFARLVDAIARAEDNENILVHNDPALAEMLTRQFPDRRTRNLSDFLTSITRADNHSLETLMTASSIHADATDENQKLLASILFESQVHGSDKIHEFVNSVIGLVAIGSVADVIPLIGENRILVKTGIDMLNSRKHQAISLLLNGETINSRTIGWSIAPLLNTPGRLGMTGLAVRFFIENEKAALKDIIAEIKSLNESRRSFISDFCSKTIIEINDGLHTLLDRLIFIKTDGIPDGYAGLIANRISDETGQPTIVAVLPGKQGLVKGSGRSHGGGKFFSVVEHFRERFDRIGGHENAFGFTLPAGDIDEVMLAIAHALDGSLTRSRHVCIDAELDLSIISIDFIRQMASMEPFGAANEEPIFISRNLRFEAFVRFGKNHGKYIIGGREGLTAIGWGMGAIMKDLFESGNPLDVAYRLENNVFNGTVSPRMVIQSVGLAG